MMYTYTEDSPGLSNWIINSAELSSEHMALITVEPQKKIVNHLGFWWLTKNISKEENKKAGFEKKTGSY